VQSPWLQRIGSGACLYGVRDPAAVFGFIQPCQPMPTVQPLGRSDWLHEIKHEGYRMIARRDGGRVWLLTRNGNDWTERYPLVAEAVAR
jgi:ATP-dependent DNA ligase